MRTLLLGLAIITTPAFANPGDTACQRLGDVFENVANRTLTSPQATVGMDALAAQVGVPAGATAAVKCTSILSHMHDRLKAAVVAKKLADIPPPTSEEVD
jgi:hypothetical protein